MVNKPKLKVAFFTAVILSVCAITGLSSIKWFSTKNNIAPEVATLEQIGDGKVGPSSFSQSSSHSSSNQSLDLPYSPTADQLAWYLENEVKEPTEQLDKTDHDENSESMEVTEEKISPQNGEPYNDVRLAAQEFEAEQYDSSWAENQQNVFFQLFSDDAELANYVLENVECKTYSCKLTVATTNHEQLLGLLNELTSEIYNKKDSFDVLIDYTEDESHANLYIKQ